METTELRSSMPGVGGSGNEVSSVKAGNPSVALFGNELGYLPPAYIPIDPTLIRVVSPSQGLHPNITSTAAAAAAPPSTSTQNGEPASQRKDAPQVKGGEPVRPPLPSPSSSGSQPSIMVYPPPMPGSTGRSPYSSAMEMNAYGVDDKSRLANMNVQAFGSWPQQPQLQPPQNGWASNPQFPVHDMSYDSKGRHTSAINAMGQPAQDRGVKRSRDSSRRPSDADEVEAGLALAGMGMGLSAGEMRERSNSLDKGSKKPKKATKEDKAKKNDKENKKSCSECRRLKAKCDRVFPCSNCRRRGCALVCPDGDLSCMQGKRLVLASTEQLHERIAHLESALFQAHAQASTKPHPLLAPQYLDGGFADPSVSPPREAVTYSPPQATAMVPTASKSPKAASSASSYTLVTPQLSAGLITTGPDGTGSQGRMAVESLLLSEATAAPEGKREDEWAGENAAPAMIVGSVGRDDSEEILERRSVIERLKDILRVLPPRSETAKRSEHFWRSSGWFQNILRKEEFDSVYEPAVYAPTPANPLSPHKLACVLMVLCLDSYFDISTDEEHPAVASYWDAVQKCFDTRFGWSASLAGVQTLALIVFFVGFGWRGARASNFFWLRLMTSQALQLGLHKDPHPSLPEEERDFRRRVFHEMYTIDCLVSINHGQRTAIQLDTIETQFPTTATLQQRMKYEYMRHVKNAVINIGCLPDNAPASWEEIMKVHQTMGPSSPAAFPSAHCPAFSGAPLPPPAADPSQQNTLELQQCTTSLCQYKAALFLYRPALRRLIQRIRTSSEERIVLSEEERTTVSMTYQACHAIIVVSIWMARSHPRIAAKSWSVWVQTFSAAVSMTALAIWAGPHLEPSFITSAYKELSQACDMIRENGSTRSKGIQDLLPILQNLVSNRYPSVVGLDPRSARVSLEGEDMLFALLGGQVDQRVIQPPTRPPSQTQPSVTQGLTYPGQAYPAGQAPTPAVGQARSGQATPVPAVALSFAPQPPPHEYTPTSSVDQQTTQQQQQQWYEQLLVPTVQAAPSAVVNDYFPIAASYQIQPQAPQIATAPYNAVGTTNGSVQPTGTMDAVVDMDPTELWARLQTFYEPTPAFWGQGAVPFTPAAGMQGMGSYSM